MGSWMNVRCGMNNLLKNMMWKSSRTLERGAASVKFLSTRTEKDGIRTITLNNPKKRNALSLEMLASIQENLTHNIDSKEIRVIVLAANGPVFSSGHDLKELRGNDASYQSKVFDLCSDVMSTIQEIPVPVIAKVNGLATAAGCQMVASCDIAVASESSSFATPGISVGLFCSTPGIAVARSVPKKIALSMLFTGQPVSAQEALMHGLVSKVVPAEKLDEETELITQRICEMSRPVIALGKKFFYHQITLDRKQAYREGGAVMVNNLNMEDGKEGLDSFLAKRKPVWKNENL